MMAIMVIKFSVIPLRILHFNRTFGMQHKFSIYDFMSFYNNSIWEVISKQILLGNQLNESQKLSVKSETSEEPSGLCYFMSS